MNQDIRQALGWLCLALVAAVASLLTRGMSEALGALLLFAAGLIGLVSLGILAWELIGTKDSD